MYAYTHSYMQDNLALWRTKIQTNTEESQKRNALLRKEKDAIQVSWHILCTCCY